MTAAEIVAEPLQCIAPTPSRRQRLRCFYSVALVRLDPALATRYPHELSGGQCQELVSHARW